VASFFSKHVPLFNGYRVQMMKFLLWLYRFVGGVEASTVQVSKPMDDLRMAALTRALNNRVYQGRAHGSATKIDVTWRIIDPFLSFIAGGVQVFFVLCGLIFVTGLVLCNENYILTGAAGVPVLVILVRLSVVTYRPSLRSAVKHLE
jgi:hypothetical protein